MINKISMMFAVVGLAIAPAMGADEHDHDHAAKTAGPNGGRVVTKVEPHFEFLVTEDRKVKITFLGEDGKAVALVKQTVKAVGGDRAKPTKFTFTKDGESLVSDVALPEGNLVPIVLQVKMTPEAKTVTEKFNVNLSDCPGCDYLEYACTCEH